MSRTKTGGALRRRRFVWSAAVCVAALAASWAGAARAGAPPDSAQLGALRSAVASGALIGISTSRYELLRRHVTVDESFVTVPRAGRPALVMAGALETGVERRIPWADIERVSEVHPRGTIGFVIGGLVGGALGGAFVGTNGPD